MLRNLLALSLLLLSPLSAGASQLVLLDVDHNANVYEIRVEMEVDAPADNVRAILTAYGAENRTSLMILLLKNITDYLLVS